MCKIGLSTVTFLLLSGNALRPANAQKDADVGSAEMDNYLAHSNGTYEFFHWEKSFVDWRRNCAKYEPLRPETAPPPSAAIQTRIAGGNLAATDERMFPYLVGLLLLRTPKVYQCGGVLISEQVVLTAAHCLMDSLVGRVYFGATDFAGSDATAVYNVTVRDFFLHERYLSYGDVNDIALVYLSTPAPLSSKVAIIPLARRFMTQERLRGEVVTLAGWGSIMDNEARMNVRLYYVEAPIMSHEECSCFYAASLVQPREHICTDGRGGRGTCEGDSGGPLTYMYEGEAYLVGLTSFGSAGGCQIAFPSVYTRITAYLDWIEHHARLKVP